MTRDELYAFFEEINDPAADYGKILGNLHYTHFQLTDRYKKILSAYDLTVAQSNILGIIAHNYPHSMALEEVKAMVLEPNSDISRTVVRLASKGFVEKIHNPKNRRKLAILATEKGLNAMQKILGDPDFRQFTERFTLEEIRLFVGFLKRLRS